MQPVQKVEDISKTRCSQITKPNLRKLIFHYNRSKLVAISGPSWMPPKKQVGHFLPFLKTISRNVAVSCCFDAKKERNKIESHHISSFPNRYKIPLSIWDKERSKLTLTEIHQHRLKPLKTFLLWSARNRHPQTKPQTECPIQDARETFHPQKHIRSLYPSPYPKP